MNRFHQKRYLVRQNFVLLIGFCLCAYFSYHMTQGDRSYMHFMSLKNDIEDVTTDHNFLKNERQLLEKKVVMLRPGSINKDLLEERVRLVLGYKHPDEKTIVSR